MRVLFVADGDSGIGLGHIMRCITLAQAFKKRNYCIDFFAKKRSSVELLENWGLGALNQIRVSDVIIVDKYDVSSTFFQHIKKRCKVLVYIDDLNKFDYQVDVLVNGSLIAEELGYQEDNFKRLLLGPQYNLLRDEFSGLPKRKLNKDVKNIMITTGGADPYNLTLKLVSFIRASKELNDIKLHIIIGAGFLNIEQLKKELVYYNNIVIHENVKTMSSIMFSCDLAISAGGGTLYELCACGTPTIGFIMAKNQEKIVTRMEECGYISNIGWYTELEHDTVIGSIDFLIRNWDKRQEMSAKQQKLVDGNGAQRVVEEILKLAKKA